VAWLLLSVLLLFVTGRILRWPKAAIRIGFVIPVVSLLYLASVSTDLARFVAIILAPFLILAFLRIRSKRNTRRQ